MQQVHVKFDDVDQIRQFVNTVNKFDASFDLGSGSRIVDAKSILGVLALDLSEPVRLRYYPHNEMIEQKIAPYVCPAV